MKIFNNRFFSILIVLQIVLGLNIAPTMVYGSDQDNAAYLDFDNDCFISAPNNEPNKTTHIYNSNERISADIKGNGLGRITSSGGSNVLDMAAPSATELSSSSASIYFGGLSKVSGYRVSWNFMRKKGSRMDITIENGVWDAEDKRLGFLRFKEDDTIVVDSNWVGEATAGKKYCEPDVWHSLEGDFDPARKLGAWYLDGKIIGYYYYKAEGTVSHVIFQAVAPDEDAVLNKETVFQIDDIESQFNRFNPGTFSANAVADEKKVSLRMSYFPQNADTITGKLVSSDKTEYSPAKIERFGKKYEFSFADGVLKPGKTYTFKIDGTVRAEVLHTKILETTSLSLGIEPTCIDVSITPFEVGGIFTNNDDVEFEVTIKNTKTSAVSAEGFLEVRDGNNSLVANSYLGTVTLAALEEKKITVAPSWSDSNNQYGSFNINIVYKPGGSETSIKKSLPFSIILSNGVQNPRMGVSTHYVDQYRTLLADFNKEIGLNKKAGFGVVRDDLQWNIYEAERGEYKLSDRQSELFKQLEENSLTPYPVLGNGTWTYGEHWPYPEGKEQLEKYGAYIRQAANDTYKYVPVFETGNEWNSSYPGHPAQNYVDMMRVAYENVKAVDENLKVVGFSIGVSDDSIAFLKECLQLGAAQYCDAVSIHPYSVLESPEEFDVKGRVSQILNILTENGAGDKELIISEWGWSTCAPNDCTEELQAKYTVRGAGLVGGMVDAIIWYEGQERYNQEIIEENFGLLRRRFGDAPYSAKPVYIALSCLNSLTGDKEQKNAQKDQNGTYSCRYENANQITIQFWNPDSTKELQIDAISGYDNAVLYDMYGNHNNINAQNGKYSLTAMDMPAYLVLSKTYPNPQLPGSELPEVDQSSIVCSHNFNNSVDFELFSGGGERIVLQDGSHSGVINFLAQKSVGEAGISQVGAIAANTPDSTKPFVVSFDFKALQPDVDYVFRAFRLDGKPFMFFKVGSNGRVGFLNNGGWTTNNPEIESVDWMSTAYNTGEWNNVDILVNPVNNLFKYFINGVCVGESRPANSLTADKPFGWLDIYSGAAKDINNNGLYWDNFRISYIDENPFCAVALRDGNTVKIDFSETPDITDGSTVKLHSIKTGDTAGVVKFDDRSIILKAPLLADNQCTLIFPEGLKSITGKPISRRIITLFRGGVPDAYIQAAELLDFGNGEYAPFDEVPVTQNYIKVTAAGAEIDLDSAFDAALLIDENGNVCELGAALATEGGIKIPIMEILNPQQNYTLTINGITTENGQVLPLYKAKFNTNDRVTKVGFTEADIVLADGTPVQTITAENKAFVSAEYVNINNSGKDAVVVIAAYSKLTGNALKLLNITAKTVDLSLAGITRIGPDNVEVSMNVPVGTDVLKGFIWDAEKSAPLIDAIVRVR